MRMLDNLKEILDEIEQASDWECGYVTDILVKMEEGKITRLSDKQFAKLVDIHEKYCGVGR